MMQHRDSWKIVLLLLGVCGHATPSWADLLSAKRGFADVSADYNILQAVNAGWYYRWGPTKPSGVGDFNANFVPMIWGGFQANQSTINTILGYDDVEWVLGFNEPEREDQANLTVGQAISAWHTLSDGFSGTGVKLISPGISDTGEGQAWLSDFMSQANSQGLQVDAVAFHWYGVSTPNDPIGAANSFISRVDSYHNTYGLPVWITEFAIHDWGENYSDEEVRAANAIFLENVVPRLESRSYVGGYAFYNWFGDSTLVEGSPLTPTNVGVEYVGAVGEGETYNLAGADFGEHVAYLDGGQLIYNGGPAPTVRYINALSGVSDLGGGFDWGVVGSGDWVRLQQGATLRKSGPNSVTLGKVRVTNEGTIDIVDGELVLQDNTRFTGDGEIRVSQSGVLRFEGVTSSDPGRFTSAILLRGGTIVSQPATPASAALDAELSGIGTVSGGLIAGAGSIIRVGEQGLSSPEWVTIDDFESYALGDLRDVASPPWTAHGNTGFADVEDAGGTKVLTYGWSSDFRGASRPLPDNATFEDGGKSTLFFRFNSKTNDPDHNFGVGVQATTTGVVYADYEAQVRLTDDANASGTFVLDARNGGAFTAPLASGLVTDTWYNVWMVVDQVTDTYDLYLTTDVAEATQSEKLNVTPLNFRNGTASPLNKLLALGAPAPIDNGVRIDSIVFLHGENLTNPLSGVAPGLFLEPATMTVEGDFEAAEGALIEIDLYSTTMHDRLVITGMLSAGGTLAVNFDPAAPTPQAGDVFDLIAFADAEGGFHEIIFPALAPGLTWDARDLLKTGELRVAKFLEGDYNADGVVDAADYTVWRDHEGSVAGTLPSDGSGFAIGQTQYDAWVANYGAALPAATASSRTPTPEPSAFLLMMLMGSLFPLHRKTWV